MPRPRRGSQNKWSVRICVFLYIKFHSTRLCKLDRVYKTLLITYTAKQTIAKKDFPDKWTIQKNFSVRCRFRKKGLVFLRANTYVQPHMQFLFWYFCRPSSNSSVFTWSRVSTTWSVYVLRSCSKKCHSTSKIIPRDTCVTLQTKIIHDNQKRSGLVNKITKIIEIWIKHSI